MQQHTDHWTFFVTNGAATLIFTRENGLPAPDVSYSEGDSTATLTLAQSATKKYDCTNYYDTRQGWPVEQCNASCSPCVCEVCGYKSIQDSSSLPTLEYGP
jgi:hypothetical protein